MFTAEELQAALQQVVRTDPRLIYSEMGKLNARTARANGVRVGRPPQKEVRCPRCHEMIGRAALSRWRTCPHDGSNLVECKLCSKKMTALEKSKNPHCPHTPGAKPLTPKEKAAIARQITEKRDQKILALVEKLGSQAAAAEKLGMSIANVNRLVKRARRD